MASPVGHSAVGLTAFLFMVRVWPRQWTRRALLLAVLIALANLPDFDFFVPLIHGEAFGSAWHRGFTHSIVFAVGVAFCLAAVMTRPDIRAGWLPLRAVWQVWAISFVLVASHLVLDMLGADDRPPFGVPLFLPFSNTHFISSWTPFKAVNHNSLAVFFAPENLLTMAYDLVLLGPLVAVAAYYCHARR